MALGWAGGAARSNIQFRRAERQTALRARARRPITEVQQRTVTETAPQTPSPEVTNIFTEAMKRYQPGGQFGKRELALLGRAKKKALARGYQSAVTAGLAGTSVPEAMGAKFQEEVGEPTRLGLEDIRSQRLTDIMMAKAGYLGGLGRGGTTTVSQFGGGGGTMIPQFGGGGGDIIGRVEPYAPTRAPIQPATQPALQSPAIGPDVGRRNLPPGSFIRGDYYYPTSTRSVPQLAL